MSSEGKSPDSPHTDKSDGSDEEKYLADSIAGEPELEFDEGGLELSSQEAELEAALEEELANSGGDGAFRSGSITPDGLIDEDFEEEIGTTSEEIEDHNPYGDIAKYGIIEVAGDDVYGRKVIVFSACKMPSSQILNHQRLLQYMKYTLDQYVESDYSLVYFHHGLNSKNKPKLSWLIQAYREFDRKYKKNLKSLYLVHPTNFIKILWNIFKPFIRSALSDDFSSVKFGRKMMYVNYLHELKEHLHFDQLRVPSAVLEHDARKLKANKPPYPYPGDSLDAHGLLKTQQFGVTLECIKENYNCIIPPVIKETVEYLRENALCVEGLFRRSANATTLKQVRQKYNMGQSVNFDSFTDVHVAAVTLKTFLRDLQEPLLTFDLFDSVTRLHKMEGNKKIIEIQRMVREELPEQNYEILKYIISFLTEVEEHCDENKMTSHNLAVCFGPNLIWSRGQASLSSMGDINTVAFILIENYEDLFLR